MNALLPAQAPPALHPRRRRAAPVAAAHVGRSAAAEQQAEPAALPRRAALAAAAAQLSLGFAGSARAFEAETVLIEMGGAQACDSAAARACALGDISAAVRLHATRQRLTPATPQTPRARWYLCQIA